MLTDQPLLIIIMISLWNCRWKTHKWRKCQLVPWSIRRDSKGAQENCGAGVQTRGLYNINLLTFDLSPNLTLMHSHGHIHQTVFGTQYSYTLTKYPQYHAQICAYFHNSFNQMLSIHNSFLVNSLTLSRYCVSVAVKSYAITIILVHYLI